MDHSKMSHAAMAAGPSFALGSHHHAISTHSVAAQKRFDEGLNWMWAFNVQEAQRSFEAAAKLDPTCAMCWWGVALSLGPHINVPALPDRTVEADKAVKKAVALESHASAEEKALIAALTHRYSDPAPTDPAKQHDLDQGYSDAMRAVSKQYPKDLDVEALYVESMLDLRPWDYWTADGKPQPGTEEIVGHLEHILAIDPTHPGANHYYIHAIEESPHPEKALAAAHRLENLMPGSGHMTHMPFHIYLRVGQYARAENVNQKAVEADLAYKKSVEVPMFMYMYTAHDYQSLSFCQMMQGKSEAAVKNARAVLDWVAPDMARQMPGVDFFLGAHDYTLARFGKWDEIQSAPPPPDGLPYLNGVRHYVRGLAFAARGDFPHAKAEKDSVSAIKGSMPPDLLEDLNSAKALLEIAEYSLAGEIAARQNETDDALAMLTKAVAAEDALHYSEPPDWQNPTRLQLGDVLMAAGQAKQAEAVYRAELAAHPEDPWGLHGLAASLRGQQKSAEAAEAEKKFAEGWAGADIQLKGTRF
ncbi:MAG TPA: tetratricopeptide repeat protein [Candidatus Udaeobacter sp.]|nr:tetratricopeptide repeat protein [Candidatus Udaeobacter sp.]